MSDAKVRCAGGGWWDQNAGVGADNRILYRESSAPCGWEGERPGRPTKVNGEIHWNVLTIPDDPCPNCRGRVELIPQIGAMTARFDGRTGRPLVPLTAEERREHVQQVIESNRQWLREQVWRRRLWRFIREVIGRVRWRLANWWTEF